MDVSCSCNSDLLVLKSVVGMQFLMEKILVLKQMTYNCNQSGKSKAQSQFLTC